MPTLTLPEFLVGWFLRLVIRPVLGPPFSFRLQRRWLEITALLNLMPPGVRRESTTLGGRPALRIAPSGLSGDGGPGTPVVLYLHGGAFVAGSPRTHQSMLGHLAKQTGGPVYAVDYRLAPEHPWPAAAEDALAAFHDLVDLLDPADGNGAGIGPGRIVVAGDSAGGAMAADLALALLAAGGPQPAGVVLLSAALGLDRQRPDDAGRRDTMVRRSWIRMALHAYLRPTGDPANRILGRDLTGFPPTHLQYSADELLADDSVQFAAELEAAGGRPELRRDHGSFHVLALLPGLLARSRAGVAAAAEFTRRVVAGPA